MRQFDYAEKWKKLLTPYVVGYLTTIHEYKGEQRLIAKRYAVVLNSIHENFPHIPIRDTFILQLHSDLYKFEKQFDGGKFKTADNIIEEEDAAGNKYVRFRPLPAEADPLLIIPMFIIDFYVFILFMIKHRVLSLLISLMMSMKALSESIITKRMSIRLRLR